MRARVTDPNGPTWPRLILPGLSLLLVFFGLLASGDAGVVKPLLLAFGAALLFGSSLYVVRHPPREAELHLGPGYVDVKEAGLLDRRIRAKDVHAASTARGEEGIEIALVCGGRDAAPIVLTVETEQQAKDVRDALGVGHYGLGALVWPAAPRPADGWNAAGRVSGVLACLLLACAAIDERWLPLAALFAAPALPIAAFSMLALLTSKDVAGTCVAFQPAGVSIGSATGGWQFIPYAHIAGASVVPGGIQIDVHGAGPIVVAAKKARFSRRGMTDAERTHVVAQILSASQRAHGAGGPPPTVGARVADLAKGSEPARVWLSRIDATAQMIAASPGYRGAGFEEEDLWTTLADHDAPSDVRAAAARVLVRIAPQRAEAKVASILASVREDGAKKRIAIAIEPDLDEASRELDELEVREGKRGIRMVS